MKKILLLIVAFVLAVSLTLPLATPVKADTLRPTLWAKIDGRITKVGYALVYDDPDNIVVQLVVYEPWKMFRTGVAIGLYVDGEIKGIPVLRNGYPNTWRFPYKKWHRSVTKYEYRIPRRSSWSAGTTLSITTFARIYDPANTSFTGMETAWALVCPAIQFPCERWWATYFLYTVQ